MVVKYNASHEASLEKILVNKLGLHPSSMVISVLLHDDNGPEPRKTSVDEVS